MLSRVAESLYWIGRNVERTQHVAQLLDVHLLLWLDSGLAGEIEPARYWQRFLILCAPPEQHALVAEPLSAASVGDFVISNNPAASILGSLSAARENARGVRESISSEVWEQVNSQYWLVRNAIANRYWHGNPHEFLQDVKSGVSLLEGLIDQTMLHDQGWSFLRFGSYFERAINTARLLDLKQQILTDVYDSGLSVDPLLHWAATLRCCWAFEAYRRYYATTVEPARVAEFLLLNRHLPRSVNFALEQALALVKQLEGVQVGRSHAERWLGNLQSRLEYATIDELQREGLHHVLDDVRRRCVDVEQGLYQQYFHGRAAPVLSETDRDLLLLFEQEQQ
ncbi:MAG TPA: alpha-E domain-containing protein [Chloroflexota bacterium]|nr:alpha-E domain-containing protein [Chloroflexota bacterium]